MQEKEKHLEGTAKVLRESQQEAEKYTTTVNGKEFVVYPNVFSPKYFFDTDFCAKELPVKEGEEFLEIGTGTGAIAIFAALRGAGRVVATDINQDAVANAKENVECHNLTEKVTVLHGSLYEPLSPTDKFDTIFWNTPFGYMESEDISTLERAVFDPGYKATRAFIEQAKQHLKPDGRLLIGFSKTLGEYDELERLLAENGFAIKQLAQTQSVETHPVTFELFEAR